jgi:hypothetical protein
VSGCWAGSAGPSTTSTSPRNNQSYADQTNAMKESAPSGANDLDNKLGSAASEWGKIQSMCSEREARVCLLTWAFTDPWSYNSTFWLLEQAKRLAAEPLDLFDARECSVGGESENGSIYVTGVSDFPVHFREGMGELTVCPPSTKRMEWRRAWRRCSK